MSNTSNSVDNTVDNKDKSLDKYTDKELGKMNKCCKCGSIIKCDGVKIDTNYICGIADYHREHPRRVVLCRECAMKLSKVVDKWFDGENCEKKKGYV